MILYICVTPLQMLIANKLICLKKDQVDVLILTYNFNKKYEYYLNILKSNLYVKNIDVIKIGNKNIFTRLSTVINIKKWNIGRQYHTAFLASVDNFFVHCVLHYSYIKEVYTYDDGVANIIETTTYFIDKSSKFSMIARKLLNMYWNLDFIKNNTKKHYTIYHNTKNIVENTENIDIFGNLDVPDERKNGEICYFLLGQPFSDKESTIRIYQKLKNHYPNIKYCVHPREEISFLKSKLNESDIIASDLIIEEYVLQKLLDGYEVMIFTVDSSAGFNLYYAKGVTVNFVIEKRLIDEVGSVYEFIKKNRLNFIELD